MRLDYDLVDLQLIINIFDTASLTRGAERSHMSPPAASARLRKVQDSLGSPLFFRTAQGLVPTAAGKVFQALARDVMAATERLNVEMNALGRTSGTIRLFVNTLPMDEQIPAAVSKFLQAHPGVNIDLQERPSVEIARALKQREADIGILTLEGSDSGLIHQDFRVEHLVAIAGENHPLAAAASVAFREMLQFDCVGLPDRTALQTFLSRMAAAEELPLRLRIQANTFDTLFGLVASGAGISVVPKTVAQGYAAKARFAIVPLTDRWAARNLQIAVSDSRVLTTASLALIELLSHVGGTPGREPARTEKLIG